MLLIIDDAIEYFIDSMPKVPFSREDVIVEFFTLDNAIERYVSLCQQYFPRKLDRKDYLNGELFEDAAAMALVGKEKVGMLFRSDLQDSATDFRHGVLHELAHIYCLLREMPRDEHFIDIYLGCTPETDFLTAEERQEDGILSAGYAIWCEFIADYIAVLLDAEGFEHDFRSGASYMSEMLNGLGIGIPTSKRAMSNFLVTIMTCSDVNKAIGKVGSLVNASIRPMLKQIVEMVYEHITLPVVGEWGADAASKCPWRIDRDFIRDLGYNYLALLARMMFV